MRVQFEAGKDVGEVAEPEVNGHAEVVLEGLRDLACAADAPREENAGQGHRKWKQRTYSINTCGQLLKITIKADNMLQLI